MKESDEFENGGVSQETEKKMIFLTAEESDSEDGNVEDSAPSDESSKISSNPTSSAPKFEGFKNHNRNKHYKFRL